MKPENSAAAVQRTVTPRTGDAPRWLPALTVATGMACALIGGQGVAWASPDDTEGAASSVSRPSTGDTAPGRSRGPRAADAPSSSDSEQSGSRPNRRERAAEDTETLSEKQAADEVASEEVSAAEPEDQDEGADAAEAEAEDAAAADLQDDTDGAGSDATLPADSDLPPKSAADPDRQDIPSTGDEKASAEHDQRSERERRSAPRMAEVSDGTDDSTNTGETNDSDTAIDTQGSTLHMSEESAESEPQPLRDRVSSKNVDDEQNPATTPPAASTPATTLAVSSPPLVTYKSVVADIMAWVGLGRWATDLPGPGLPLPRLLASAWLVVRESQYKRNNQRPAADPTAATTLNPDGAVIGELNATDFEDDSLTYTVTGTPTHGTVVVDEDGNFTYVPDVPDGSAVIDQFTVTIDDTVGNPAHYYGLLGLAGVLKAPTVTVHVTVTSLGDVSIAPPPRPLEAALLAAQAYLYGYPLLETERLQDEAPGTNTLIALTSYVDPEQRLVVAPNVDTLYTLAYLDLSEGPVVLSHPDMADRYFGFQLMDPYTNVVGYIGSRTTGSEAASYAIVWEDGPQGEIPPDAEAIVVPYADIWLLGRTAAGDEADQQEAVALMRQYTITAPGEPPTYPIEDFDTTTSAPLPTGIDALDAISAAMVASPPPTDDADKLAELARVGVGPGLEVSDADLSPASQWAAQAAVRTISALLGPLVSVAQYAMAARNDGWASPDPAIGDYGTDYLLRAGVAKIGLGANTPEEAYYATAFLDENLRRLNGRHSYQLHFEPGQEPPADAFWSITVYDSDGFLVPNEQEIYAVSSTGSGDLVYQEDGSIDIVFSQEDPQDPTVNWIPVPDGAFRVYLRVYVPQDAVLEGDWVAPGIERI
ncbi:hypothetical protein GCM10009645_38510 [Mycolicibacterium poriferae]|uniref:DUF1214 domain-containing protein n=1 Tax=Mycolicibacterium poriferae TaxID=39694 RepID=A0A6N4V3X1_9MYCO|nr:DUF1254 domain-containing protein [Mycolicibacterium poriferae]MCV7263368.1 DUF1254 domain-containing protein [Mycolicibacterium poriferae]BBX50176.1 hypothetical protein MPOR_12020 [Mycolicibacterium poriferae]